MWEYFLQERSREKRFRELADEEKQAGGSKAAMTSDRVVSDLMLPLWEEVLWPFLDAWDSVRLRTSSTQKNLPGDASLSSYF